MTCFRMKDGKTLMQFAKETGLPYSTLWGSLDRGLTVEEAVEHAQKVKKHGARHNCKFFINGVSAYKVLGKTHYARVYDRMKYKCMTFEEALKYKRGGKKK